MGKQIGFVSTRFAGTDGVTLEASKWVEVLEQKGHQCFWFAGELDREEGKCFLVPEAHFRHEQNEWINARIWGKKGRKPSVTETIHALKSILKVQIQEFLEKFSIDLIIAENALTIPMHAPLIPFQNKNREFFFAYISELALRLINIPANQIISHKKTTTPYWWLLLRRSSELTIPDIMTSL